ncbi:MAG: hypothetical protein GC184_03375 [Rhizobiales bacterium]|nr:hypothetical protein [Hyphomicrobiales bacterium]
MRRHVTRDSLPQEGDLSEEILLNPKFCHRAYATYRSLDPDHAARFIYLDVKSLPRTGLHFMRNSFETLLQKQFSFCEWYNEPGCCRQMPCAVTGYAIEQQDILHLRMIKSHDFDLADPVFPAKGAVRRLILLRDPVYLLTSWWALRVLFFQRDLLKRHGITQRKIDYTHDRRVIKSAYRIIDDEGVSHTRKELRAWMLKVLPYLLGFAQKWAKAIQDNPQDYKVVRYSETPQAVLDVLEQIAPQLPADARQRVEDFRINKQNVFQARSDPFVSQSESITAFLRNEADAFHAAATALKEQDQSGLLFAGSEN